MDKTIVYRSTGIVYGNYWGGGKGSYKAKNLTSNTKEDLIKQAEKGLDGSLDDGMGYESLIGALLEITAYETIIIDDKSYVNEDVEIVFIGNLTEEEQDWLLDVYNHS